MTVDVRPYLAAGVVALGAGVVSVPPVQDASASARMSFDSYSLTAAEAPAADVAGNNLLALVLSMPAWEVQAMNRFADAMAATGNWQVWGPTNVFGFDEQDPPKLKAFIDMTMPIQPFSSVFGEQVSVWAQANLPMNAGCAAKPGACPDLNALVDTMFKVPTSQLNEGYQFPAVTNPFTGEPTSWSGKYVKLDPAAPVNSLQAYLNGPAQVAPAVTGDEFAAAVGRVVQSVSDAFNPFVPNSEWFNIDQTGLADVFRVLAPNFCPTCNPDNLYDNPWLYDNYPPKSVPVAAAAATAEIVTPPAGPAVEADPVTPAASLAAPAEDTDPVNESDFAEPVEESPAAASPSSRETPSAKASDTADHQDGAGRTRRGSRHAG